MGNLELTNEDTGTRLNWTYDDIKYVKEVMVPNMHMLMQENEELRDRLDKMEERLCLLAKAQDDKAPPKMCHSYGCECMDCIRRQKFLETKHTNDCWCPTCYPLRVKEQCNKSSPKQKIVSIL